MKLRLRSLESKQTHRIEVPNTFNLQQLKEYIFLQLFPSSSSSSSALQQHLLLSLNRKEELCGSSPEDSIQSLGVTSGDLIYYTTIPFAFSSQIPNLLGISREISANNMEFVESVNTQKVESVNLDELNVPVVEIRDLNDAQVKGTSNLNNPKPNDTGILKIPQIIDPSKVHYFNRSSTRTRDLIPSQMEGSSNSSDPNVGKSIDLVEEADEMEVDDESEFKGNYRFSVPNFLKKVYVKEMGDDVGNDDEHKLLVIAVHAVLLESGFVAYDSVTGMKVERFHLNDEWPSLAFGMTLHYTLPKVSKVVETVNLKFEAMGRFVNIYGSLSKKGLGVYRVSLDEPRFLPALSFIWKRGDPTCFHGEMGGNSRKLFPNHEIFEFWKIVKDGLSYPLLIDLCERVGAVPPPCLMRLPTELKLKIFESLPAADVARVECVCSELRFVASNNDLWKLKYEEEFGNTAKSLRECQWKAKFSSVWEIRKKRKKICRPLQFREPPHFRPLFPGRRDPYSLGSPNPFGSPFIIGGDYDRLANIDFPPRRNFRRNCDLREFGL